MDKVRTTHRSLMSRAINDKGTLSNLIFTNGTAFNSGTSTIYGGACFFHNSYPNLSFIFSTEISSTISAEFSAVVIAIERHLK